MKLIYRIIFRVSIAITVILTVWAIFFYFAIVDEINDETDDTLEDYSEIIITKALRGEELPNTANGTNNSYFINEISCDYANKNQRIRYIDSMVYIQYKRETEPARILSTIYKDKDNRYFELTVSIPTIEQEDLKKSILFWIIFLYAALLLTIIVINVWLVRGTMRPMYDLLKWLDNYKLGKKNQPLENDTSVVEFRKLNEAAIRNAERAEQMFEQQKQFIDNASHEIQTPLAICQNRLELLAEDSSLSEKNLEEIFKTLQTIEHITKLNKSLLLLTKIDNNQFADVKEIDLNETIAHYLVDYKEVFSYKDLDISIVDNGKFIVTMNESLAVVLITNMIKNAFIHCNNNGSLHITTTSSSLLFANSGTTALDSKQVFSRFYQGSKKEGSTGLGLAIINSICSLYNLKISYSFTDSFHCFKIIK